MRLRRTGPAKDIQPSPCLPGGERQFSSIKRDFIERAASLHQRRAHRGPLCSRCRREVATRLLVKIGVVKDPDLDNVKEH